MPDFDPADYLRLEVAVDPEPGELVNLHPNPNGDLGGFGYVSPTVNSLVRRGRSYSTGENVVEYVSGQTTNTANYFRTEALPVTPGKWVAYAWTWHDTGMSRYRARLHFLDAAGTDTTLPYITVDERAGHDPSELLGPVRHYSAPVQVPAGTVSIQVSWEIGFTSGSGTPYPMTLGGMSFQIGALTIAQADTVAELGTVRHNLTSNPSFEVDTSGWSAALRVASISRLSDSVAPSPYVLDATIPPTDDMPAGANAYVNTDVSGIQAGRKYAVQCQINPQNNGETFTGRIRVLWYDKNGNQIDSQYSEQVPLTDYTYTPVSGVFTAPTGATLMRVSPHVVMSANSGGSRHWRLDQVMVELGEEIGSYFDGNTPAADGWTYEWQGTIGKSTSIAVNSNLPYLEPVTFYDILGDSNNLSIVREDLNVGTLTASVVNPDLDPSVAATLRPGRQYRVMAHNPDTDTWEPLIVGKSSNIKVDYLPLNDEPHRALIALTGNDNVTPLASAKRPKSVATIRDLPSVLEGAGVPWNCDGQTGQVASPKTVVSSDNASALDQVALTRDTALGYAWMDRYGILQAWSTLEAPEATDLRFDFETASDAAHWWDGGTGSALAAGVTPPVPAPDGGKVLQITAKGGLVITGACYGSGALGDQYGDNIPVTGGREYSVTWSALGSHARQSTLYVDFYASGGTSLGSIGAENMVYTSTTDWTTRTLTFTAPPDATNIALNYIIGDDGWTRGTSNGTPLPTNETHYLDAVHVASAPVPDPLTLDDEVYNPNLSIDYDTDSCVNSVTVRRQFTDAAGESQETVYGPYTDTASIDQWGVHAAEFTVAGIAANKIPAYAQRILAANAVPQRKVHSLEIPVTAETLRYAFLDLYDRVHFINAETDLDQDLRITSITHQIQASDAGNTWLVVLGFDSEGSVASPTAQPPLGATAPADNMIQSGNVTVPGGGAVATKDITFPVPYASAPAVVANTTNSFANAAAYSISATGFSIAVRRFDGASMSGDQSCSWIASGPPKAT